MKAESMFVSYVFHEMRNPFNGMVGHLECIEESVGGAIKLMAATSNGGTNASNAPGGKSKSASLGGFGDGSELATHLESKLKSITSDLDSTRICSQHMSDILNNGVCQLFINFHKI